MKIFHTRIILGNVVVVKEIVDARYAAVVELAQEKVATTVSDLDRKQYINSILCKMNCI